RRGRAARRGRRRRRRPDHRARDRAAGAPRPGSPPGAGAAGAAVDDPQDVERQDPALAPRGDDPGRRDRPPRHWIGARARITRGWPERDAFGLSLARLCHLPVYGPAATRDTLVGFARRAEALGYDSLWASDYVVLPWRIASRYPYNATGASPL